MANRSDNYNRADSALLIGSPSDGLADPTVAGTWGISSNRAYNVSGGINESALYESSLADVAVQVTLATVGSTCGVAARATDAGSNLLLVQQSSGNVILYRQAGAGAFTTLGTFAHSGSPGDVLKLTCSGSTLNAYLNGSPVIGPITETFNQAATLHGLYTYSDSAARFDDFSAAALASDTTAPVVANANVNAAGTTLAINFTEAGSPPVLPASSVAGFTLTASGGAVTLSSAAISGTAYTATTGRTIATGETLTLAYAPGNVTDSAATPNALASFSGTAVTNNSTQAATATTYTATLSPTTITAGQTTAATVTPNAAYTGTITGTPSGSASTGLSAVVLTFSASAVAQTASWTPTAAGTLTITWSNNHTLTNPGNGTVTVNAPALVAGTASFDSCGPAGGTAFIKVTATAATGGTPTYTYQWQRNVGGGSYSNISGAGITGATTLTLTDATATAGNLYGYRIVATDSAGTPATATSGAVTAQVYTGGALTGGGFRPVRFGGGF